MQLDKYEEKQVSEISAFQATSNQLKTTADVIEVYDEDTLKQASKLIKDINAHKKLVSEKRLELTQPLNNVIKQLIAKEKEVLIPLDEGKNVTSEKILAYQEELEQKRIAEESRVNDIVDEINEHGLNIDTIKRIDDNGAQLKEYFSALSENDQSNPTIKVAFLSIVGQLTERKTQLEEEARLEAERQRQAEEQKKLDEAATKQSEEEARIAAERREIEDQKREIENSKLEIEREKARIEREKEQAKAQAEAEKARKVAGKSAPKINAVTMTKFEVIDADAVSRAYCSPDESKIREAIKNGITTIAGVEIYQETKVR